MSEKLIRPMTVSERLEMRLEGSPEPNNDNGYAMYPNWQLRIEIADTKALESSLAQAQADVEALRVVIFAVVIPACESPLLRGAKTQHQQARFLDDLRGRILAALPEYLRGASR